ncbi:MAG: hypothetical protein QM783_01985 [Phycisphaerales bacterium]
MPSLRDQYNEEVLQGHREALAALRDLLAAEKDPTERRRLACAILKTRPVKASQPPAASAHRAEEPVPEQRTTTDQPTPFWSAPSPIVTPTPFGDSALGHAAPTPMNL